MRWNRLPRLMLYSCGHRTFFFFTPPNQFPREADPSGARYHSVGAKLPFALPLPSANHSQKHELPPLPLFLQVCPPEPPPGHINCRKGRCAQGNESL